MFLTRLFLDPSARTVRADLADPDGLHKTVMRMFPSNLGERAREQLGVLHRLDDGQAGRPVVLVQSKQAPDAAALPRGYLVDLTKDAELAFSGVAENPSIRNVEGERAGIATGHQFLFRLKASTTRKILTKTGPDGRRSNGKRVPVNGDEARLEWLRRHAAAGGFTFSDLRVNEVRARGHQGPERVRVAGAIFDGTLCVGDLALFQRALTNGVGPAKAYGFGLLSIRQVPGAQ